MSYLTVAPCVLVKVPGHGANYRVDYHYAGSVIPWLSDVDAERFLAEGFVEKLDASEAEVVAPKKTATQEEWATYAISKGANPEEARAANRQELIELYGG